MRSVMVRLKFRLETWLVHRIFRVCLLFQYPSLIAGLKESCSRALAIVHWAPLLSLRIRPTRQAWRLKPCLRTRSRGAMTVANAVDKDLADPVRGPALSDEPGGDGLGQMLNRSLREILDRVVVERGARGTTTRIPPATSPGLLPPPSVFGQRKGSRRAKSTIGGVPKRASEDSYSTAVSFPLTLLGHRCTQW